VLQDEFLKELNATFVKQTMGTFTGKYVMGGTAGKEFISFNSIPALRPFSVFVNLSQGIFPFRWGGKAGINSLHFDIFSLLGPIISLSTLSVCSMMEPFLPNSPNAK
jgi:hypothetical protein